MIIVLFDDDKDRIIRRKARRFVVHFLYTFLSMRKNFDEIGDFCICQSLQKCFGTCLVICLDTLFRSPKRWLEQIVCWTKSWISVLNSKEEFRGETWRLFLSFIFFLILSFWFIFILIGRNITCMSSKSLGLKIVCLLWILKEAQTMKVYIKMEEG